MRFKKEVAKDMKKIKLFRNYQYLSDANYLVVINNMLLGFSRVKNLSCQQERENVEEGGEEVPISVEAVSQKMETLILEKAVAVDLESILARTLVPGCEIYGMCLLIMTGDRKIRKTFFMENGIVVKRSFSDLNAESGDIFRLSLEISHTGLVEI